MISALSISTAGMAKAADRLEDIAIGIANPTPANSPDATVRTEQQLRATDPVAPVSSLPSLDASRLVELVETETAFKASALATKSVTASSQELMEALR